MPLDTHAARRTCRSLLVSAHAARHKDSWRRFGSTAGPLTVNGELGSKTDREHSAARPARSLTTTTRGSSCGSGRGGCDCSGRGSAGAGKAWRRPTAVGILSWTAVVLPLLALRESSLWGYSASRTSDVPSALGSPRSESSTRSPVLEPGSETGSFGRTSNLRKDSYLLRRLGSGPKACGRIVAATGSALRLGAAGLSVAPGPLGAARLSISRTCTMATRGAARRKIRANRLFRTADSACIANSLRPDTSRMPIVCNERTRGPGSSSS